MKKAFLLIIPIIIFLTDGGLAHYYSSFLQSGNIKITEASLDGNLIYILVSASIIGIVKLKKNPG